MAKQLDIVWVDEGQATQVVAPEGDMFLPFSSKTHDGSTGKKNEEYDDHSPENLAKRSPIKE